MTGRRTGIGRQMSNLHARILTGFFLGIFVLWLTWAGGLPFTVFCILIGGIVFYEWNGLAARLQNPAVRICGWICLAAVGAALLAAVPSRFIFLVLLGGGAVLALFSGRGGGWVAGGFIYSAFPAVSLNLLRGHETFGMGGVCFLFAVVWGTDIGAYFCGRSLGGPKLAPALSPGKTWSGAVGGAVVGVGCGVCVAWLMMDIDPSGFAIVVLAFMLSVISQFGDMGESWIKRHFGVKDSGRILPGHGGVMDRVDGLLAASAALYVIGAGIAGADDPSGLFHFL